MNLDHWFNRPFIDCTVLCMWDCWPGKHPFQVINFHRAYHKQNFRL